MAKIVDIQDCKEAVIAQAVIIEHLTDGLMELKQIVADHIKGHGRMFYWAVPTILLIIQIVVTTILLMR